MITHSVTSSMHIETDIIIVRLKTGSFLHLACNAIISSVFIKFVELLLSNRLDGSFLFLIGIITIGYDIQVDKIYKYLYKINLRTAIWQHKSILAINKKRT